jgi:hypothetical protein
VTEGTPMQWELIIDDDVPERDELIDELHETAPYAVV